MSVSVYKTCELIQRAMFLLLNSRNFCNSSCIYRNILLLNTQTHTHRVRERRREHISHFIATMWPPETLSHCSLDTQMTKNIMIMMAMIILIIYELVNQMAGATRKGTQSI